MRAASVLLIEKRMGADNSGASRRSLSKASVVIFNRMLSLLAMTSAERGPWSKRAISPKHSPGPSVVRIVSLPPIKSRTRNSPSNTRYIPSSGSPCLTICAHWRTVCASMKHKNRVSWSSVSSARALTRRNMPGVMSDFATVGWESAPGAVGVLFLLKKSCSSGRVAALRQRSFWRSNIQVSASTRSSFTQLINMGSSTGPYTTLSAAQML